MDGFAVTMSRMIAGWDDCEYHNVLKVLDRKYSVRQVGLIYCICPYWEYHNVLKVLDRKYSVRQVGLIDMF